MFIGETSDDRSLRVSVNQIAGRVRHVRFILVALSEVPIAARTRWFVRRPYGARATTFSVFNRTGMASWPSKGHAGSWWSSFDFILIGRDVVDEVRGTGGSGGTFGFFDGQERRDMHDLVEWAAAQPWSNGEVGMIGISYFAGTQMEAAVERPPHLKAIMPIAGTFDLYDSATHHGLMSSGFITPFLYMIGMTSGHTNKLWRSKLIGAVRAMLLTPAIHKKFEHANGEAAIAGLKMLLKLHHDPHPWDDLWPAIAAEHPLRDARWEDRNLLPLLDRIEVPVYIGCDWQNVPLHLPHTFTAWEKLTNSKHVQVAMMGEHGLAWP